MGSRNSVAVGIPKSSTSPKKVLAIRKPFGISQDPFNWGSMIKPFQPTVVRGFSKYTLMTIKTRSFSSPANFAKRVQRIHGTLSNREWNKVQPRQASAYLLRESLRAIPRVSGEPVFFDLRFGKFLRIVLPAKVESRNLLFVSLLL